MNNKAFDENILFALIFDPHAFADTQNIVHPITPTFGIFHQKKHILAL